MSALPRFGIEATFATAERVMGGHLEKVVPS
jgi:hypothetical protein